MFHDKSPLAYATMLACLGAGLPYVNLDAEAPEERNKNILASCKAKMTIAFEEGWNGDDRPHLLLRRDSLPVTSDSVTALSEPDSGEELAYIMFTSGSTGKPKGAMISHDNLFHFIRWGKEEYKVETEDRFSNLNPMYFDNSVFDFYVSIFNGASLIPVPPSSLRNPKPVVDQLGERGCSIWFSVPSLLIYALKMRALNQESLPMIRAILFGGEGFPKNPLRRLHEILAPRAKLFNVYGPTECTCICSSREVRAPDLVGNGLVPLGRLSRNFTSKFPESPQEPFELCLMGPLVGKGYINDPERTRVSFVMEHGTSYPMKAYRTGDLVTLDDHGELSFVGRLDHQVKRMGFRIELEEIEHSASELGEVEACSAIFFPNDEGPGSIVLFCSPSNVEKDRVRDHLLLHLPRYMLPDEIQCIEKMPLNSNGKIDRKGLHEKC